MKELLRLPKGLQGRVWYHPYHGSVHPRHHHAELELNLVVRGTGTYLVKDRTYQMQRNDLLWLFPEQEHILIDMSKDFAMWILVWSPALVKATSAGSDAAKILRADDPTGHFCRRLANPAAARLNTMFDDLLGQENDQAHYHAGLAYGLMQAWSAFSSGTDIPAGAIVHSAVEQAVRLLRQDEAAYSLPDLAKRTGLSSGRLSRLFNEQIGMPLVEFRNRQRLERFLAMRRDNQDGNLLELALSAGFGSYPQFHRVFSRLVGCSPARHAEKNHRS